MIKNWLRCRTVREHMLLMVLVLTLIMFFNVKLFGGM